jgi:hypothetical protein
MHACEIFAVEAYRTHNPASELKNLLDEDIDRYLRRESAESALDVEAYASPTGKPTPKYHRHLPTRGRMLLSPDRPERIVAVQMAGVLDLMGEGARRLSCMIDSHRDRGALNAERLRGRNGSPGVEISVFSGPCRPAYILPRLTDLPWPMCSASKEFRDGDRFARISNR